MKKLRILVILLLVLLCASVVMAAAPEPINIRGPFASSVALEATYPNTFHPVSKQIFPEGCVGHGFETWLVIYNSSNQPANVVVMANGDGFFSVTEPFMVEGHQRRTIDANGYYKWQRPDVSFQVLADYPGVYAQVSMYWEGGGHTSVGFMK